LFFVLFLSARANLEMTLSAVFDSAQYYVSLAVMLFRNIRNQAMKKLPPRS
jgi:hypothetical protein